VLTRIDLAPPARQSWSRQAAVALTWPPALLVHRERRPIDVFWIIVIALAAIVALAVISFALHFLLSPWLLIVAIGVLAWLKFRPRRASR
jgi:hypothetical protein